MQLLLYIVALSTVGQSQNTHKSETGADHATITKGITSEGNVLSPDALIRNGEAMRVPQADVLMRRDDAVKAALVSYHHHKAQNVNTKDGANWSWPWADGGAAKSSLKAEPQAVHQGQLGDISAQSSGKTYHKVSNPHGHSPSPPPHGGSAHGGSAHGESDPASDGSSVELAALTYLKTAISEIERGYTVAETEKDLFGSLHGVLSQVPAIAHDPSHPGPDLTGFPFKQDPYLSEWVIEAGVSAQEWQNISVIDQLMIASELEQSKAFEETKAEYEGLSFPDMEPLEESGDGGAHGGHGDGGAHGGDGDGGAHGGPHSGGHGGHSLSELNSNPSVRGPSDDLAEQMKRFHRKFADNPHANHARNTNSISFAESQQKAVARLHHRATANKTLVQHGKILPLVPAAIAASAAVGAAAAIVDAVDKETASNSPSPTDDVNIDRKLQALLEICEDTVTGAIEISTKPRDPHYISVGVCTEKFHELMIDILASLDHHPTQNIMHHYEALAAEACKAGETELDEYLTGIPADAEESPPDVEEAYNVYCRAVAGFVRNHPIKACFPADASVLVRGPERDRRTALRDLHPGDLVAVGDKLTGSITFTPVLTDLHSEEEHSRGAVRYLMLSHSLGSLNLTSNHFVATKERGLLPAGEVLVGDELLVQPTLDSAPDSSGHLVASKVTAVTSVIKSGMYAPLTWGGLLLVDGVLASSYIVPPEKWLSSLARGRLVSLFGWNGLHNLEHTLMLPVRVAHAIGLPSALERLVEWKMPGANELYRLLSPHDLNLKVSSAGWGVPRYVDIMGEFTGGLLEMLV